MGAHSGRGSCWGSIDPCAAWFCRRAIGGVQKATTGECREPPKKEKKKKNLSEGRGKCINDPVTAGLTGLHGHGWANGYYTATCAKKKRLWATSLCLAVKYVGAQKFCVMLLRRHPDGVDIVA